MVLFLPPSLSLSLSHTGSEVNSPLNLKTELNLLLFLFEKVWLRVSYFVTSFTSLRDCENITGITITLIGRHFFEVEHILHEIPHSQNPEQQQGAMELHFVLCRRNVENFLQSPQMSLQKLSFREWRRYCVALQQRRRISCTLCSFFCIVIILT